MARLKSLLKKTDKKLLAVSCGTGAFLLLIFAFAILPANPVWITDNGNKYIQMRNFAETGSRVIRHNMPELFPTAGFHFQKTPQGVRSFLPEYFPLLSALPYRLLGDRGVTLWAMIATVAVLFLCGRFFGIPPLYLLFTSPLLFYSFTLWEMTPSVVFAAGGLALVLAGNFGWAGVIFALGLWMREELYFVAGILFGTLLIFRRRRDALKLAGGFLAAALPLWMFQYYECGHILGLHGKLYHSNNDAGFNWLAQLGRAGENYARHLLGFNGFAGNSIWNWLAFSALLPVLAGFLPRKYKKIKLTALTVYLVSIFVLLIALWKQEIPVYAAAGATGVISVLPVCMGFWLNLRLWLKHRRTRLWSGFLLLYMLGVPLVLTTADVGLVWGPRHFLVILPLLYGFAWRGWRMIHNKHAFAAALGVSVLLQMYSLTALRQVSIDSAGAAEAIRSSKTQAVASDVFFLPEQTPQLFFEKDFLQVLNRDDIRNLQKRGVKEFTLVLSPTFRRLTDPDLAELLKRYPAQHQPVRYLPAGKFPELLIVRCGK